MTKFNRPAEVRWSDLDPNFHVRHSVYYDWGAATRVAYLYQVGLTAEVMQRTHIGPILFREECIFRKEIRLEDIITVGLEVVKAKRDFSRWTIRHPIMKNGDTVAAILTVDIAWIDTLKRKLAVVPDDFNNWFKEAPMAEDFQWLD
jgi:acyl-CoA thioester hydrolase